MPPTSYAKTRGVHNGSILPDQALCLSCAQGMHAALPCVGKS